MTLPYQCPDCGTALGYKGLSLLAVQDSGESPCRTRMDARGGRGKGTGDHRADRGCSR